VAILLHSCNHYFFVGANLFTSERQRKTIDCTTPLHEQVILFEPFGQVINVNNKAKRRC
jgi:hypothetical protein